MTACSSLVFITIFCFGYYACGDVDPMTGGFRTMQVNPKVTWNETNLDKLKKDLFMNYDKYAHYNITEVAFGLAMTYLETEELKSTVTLHAWLRMVWNDPKLSWNKDDYGGIAVTRIADHEIWQPDIYLYNSVLGAEPIVRYGNPNVMVYPEGQVLWVPPTKLTAMCKFNLRYWPFDTQHCYFRFGSWTHSGNEITLKLYNNLPVIAIEPTTSYSAWNISNTTAEVVLKYYDCCAEPYYYIQYNVTLVRKSDSYKALIVTPAAVNALLILMQFWLPPQAKEKMILSCFVAVTLVLFLVYFTNHICAGGYNTPLIVLFYSCSLCMVCFTMIGNVAAFWLARNKRIQSLVSIIKKCLKGRLAKWLFLELKFKEIDVVIPETLKYQNRRSSVFESRSEYETLKLSSSTCTQEEWIFAVLVNRVLFIIYSLIFLIFGLVYLL